MVPSLPIEVMQLALNEVTSKADLFRLMLVASKWRNVAEVHLYKSVELTVGVGQLETGKYDAQITCFRTITSPRISPMVKRLDFVLCPELEDITDRPFDYRAKPLLALLKAMHDALSKTSQLEILGIRGLMHDELWVLDNLALPNLDVFIGPDCGAYRVEKGSRGLRMLVVSECRGCDQFKDTCAVLKEFSDAHAKSLVILAFEWDENDVNRVMGQAAARFPELFELEVFGIREEVRSILLNSN
jgi:hypothetical protein